MNSAYAASIKLLIKRLLLILILYQLCRVLFFIFNRDSFQDLTLWTFIGGVHFDISSIIYTNLLVILGHSVPGNFKYRLGYQKLLKLLFFFCNTLAIITNCIDIEYFKFTGRRSTINLITAQGMHQEIVGLLGTYMLQYWHIVFILTLLLVTLYKATPDLKFSGTPSETQKRTAYRIGAFLLLLGITFLLGRGRIHRKPLKMVDAINYSSDTSLVLNTPFCILKTLFRKEALKERKYYNEVEQKAIFSPIKTFKDSLPTQKKNVMIIILESFGNESVGAANDGKGYTPFLDSLITESLYFKNGFANGRRSIDAVPSIISSIPSLMEKTFTLSRYSFNNVKTLPKILNKEGYYSSFFHGGYNGGQDFDKYAKIAGFKDYFGREQYPYPHGDDGNWGIFDEEFLKFFNEKLITFKQPFFTTIFTLSSHPPFKIPKKHTGRFPKGALKIQESVGYADYALRTFFEKAKKQDWYKNTLFVLCADHCSSEGNGFYKTTLGKFTIPLVFFDPSNKKLKGVSEKNFQQIDIFPAILEYLNYSGAFISYGNEISKEDRLIAFYLNNLYHFIKKDYYLIFDGEKTQGLYNIKTDRMQKNNLKDSHTTERLAIEREAKAYIQSFNHRMIHNKLTVE